MFSCFDKRRRPAHQKITIFHKCVCTKPLQARNATGLHRINAGRKTYKTFLGDSGGSVTVEASLVLPLFILAMLSVFYMGETVIVRNTVYEAMQESAQYMAEISYLCETGDTSIGINAVTAKKKLKEYIDDSDLIAEYVSGGTGGIKVTRAVLDDDDHIYMEIKYTFRINVPVFGSVKIPCEERICQRAYLGYDTDKDDDSQGTYVYVAENGYVYHKSRSCYHISLTIHQVSETQLRESYGNFTECSVCGSRRSSGKFYVTAEGDHYHTSLECSGLKRTVYRKKKDECSGLAPCSECCGD